MLDLGKSQMAFRRIFESANQRSSLVGELLGLRHVTAAQSIFLGEAQRGASLAPFSGNYGEDGGAGTGGGGASNAVRDGVGAQSFATAQAIASGQSTAPSTSELGIPNAFAKSQGLVAAEAEIGNEGTERAKSVGIDGAHCSNNGDATTPRTPSFDEGDVGAGVLPPTRPPLPPGRAGAAAAVTRGSMRVVSVKLRSERVDFLVAITTTTTDSGRTLASLQQQSLLAAVFPANTKPLRIDAEHAKSKKRKHYQGWEHHHQHGTASHDGISINVPSFAPKYPSTPFTLSVSPSRSWLLHAVPEKGFDRCERCLSSRDVHEKFATEEPDGLPLQLSHFPYTQCACQKRSRGRDQPEARTVTEAAAVMVRGPRVAVSAGATGDPHYRATHLWPWLELCVDLVSLSQWRDERRRSIDEVGLLQLDQADATYHSIASMRAAAESFSGVRAGLVNSGVGIGPLVILDGTNEHASWVPASANKKNVAIHHDDGSAIFRDGWEERAPPLPPSLFLLELASMEVPVMLCHGPRRRDKKGASSEHEGVSFSFPVPPSAASQAVAAAASKKRVNMLSEDKRTKRDGEPRLPRSVVNLNSPFHAFRFYKLLEAPTRGYGESEDEEKDGGKSKGLKSIKAIDCDDEYDSGKGIQDAPLSLSGEQQQQQGQQTDGASELSTPSSSSIAAAADIDVYEEGKGEEAHKHYDISGNGNCENENGCCVGGGSLGGEGGGKTTHVLKTMLMQQMSTGAHLLKQEEEEPSSTTVALGFGLPGHCRPPCDLLVPVLSRLSKAQRRTALKGWREEQPTFLEDGMMLESLVPGEGGRCMKYEMHYTRSEIATRLLSALIQLEPLNVKWRSSSDATARSGTARGEDTCSSDVNKTCSSSSSSDHRDLSSKRRSVDHSGQRGRGCGHRTSNTSDLGDGFQRERCSCLDERIELELHLAGLLDAPGCGLPQSGGGLSLLGTCTQFTPQPMPRKLPLKVQPKVRCVTTTQQSIPLKNGKVAIAAAAASVVMPCPSPHNISAFAASLHKSVSSSHLSPNPSSRRVAVAGKSATAVKEGLHSAQSTCEVLLFGFREMTASSCSAVNRSRTLRQVHEEVLSYPWPLVDSAAVGMGSARPPFRLSLLKRHKKRRKCKENVGGDKYEGDDGTNEGDDKDGYAFVEDDEDEDEDEGDLNDATQRRGCGAKRRRINAQRLPHGPSCSEHQLAMAGAETRRLEALLEAQVRDNNRRLKALEMPVLEKLKNAHAVVKRNAENTKLEAVARGRYAKLRRREKDRARRACVSSKRTWPPALVQ